MSSHYKFYKSTKNGYYWFKTSNEVIYRCVFTQADNLFGVDVNSSIFFFNLLRKQAGIKTRFDSKVSETVGVILNKFFVKNTGSIIAYICDESDGKGHKRQASFEKWFTKHNCEPKKMLIKADIASLVYLGAIMLSTNLDRENIERHFKRELNEFIQSEKSGSIDIVE